MAERRILDLTTPDGRAEVLASIVPRDAWQQFYDGVPIVVDEEVERQREVVLEARNAGLSIDARTLSFVSRNGNSARLFAPHLGGIYTNLLDPPENITASLVHDE